MSEYKICKRCIMDTTSDPDLILDADGICNYCHAYDAAVKRIEYKKINGEKKLEDIFNTIKADGKGKEYDCLLGIDRKSVV